MRKINTIATWMLAALLGASCMSGGASAQSADDRSEAYELPEWQPDEDIVRHLGYTASYNHLTLTPDWVAWQLTSAEAAGQLDGQYSFSRDPNVRQPKASREDYSNSGWDKGHMAPRADMKWSHQALEESYYFTNICPQEHTMNAGAWRKVEQLTRRMAGRYDTVYVVCGPLYRGDEHTTIGDAGVCVPEAFFKALAVRQQDGWHTVGFIMENNPQEKSPRHYATTVDEVEAMVGRNLFPLLPEEAEQTYDWTFWK